MVLARERLARCGASIADGFGQWALQPVEQTFGELSAAAALADDDRRGCGCAMLGRARCGAVSTEPEAARHDRARRSAAAGPHRVRG